jgi:hypothetical protein
MKKKRDKKEERERERETDRQTDREKLIKHFLIESEDSIQEIRN